MPIEMMGGQRSDSPTLSFFRKLAEGDMTEEGKEALIKETVQQIVEKERALGHEPPPRPACSLCEDTGWQEYDRKTNQVLALGDYTPNRTYVKRCICRAKDDVEAMLHLANIPTCWRDKGFKEFVPTTEYQKNSGNNVKYFVNDFVPGCKGLFLYGPTGTGKTHLAIAALKSLCRKHHAGYFTTAKDIVITEKYGSAQWERALACTILVLDELGAEKYQEDSWQANKILDLINRRLSDNKTSLVTSNYELIYNSENKESMLSTRIGLRAVSRLQEMLIPVRFYGRDYRITMNQQEGGLQ